MDLKMADWAVDWAVEWEELEDLRTNWAVDWAVFHLRSDPLTSTPLMDSGLEETPSKREGKGACSCSYHKLWEYGLVVMKFSSLTSVLVKCELLFSITGQIIKRQRSQYSRALTSTPGSIKCINRVSVTMNRQSKLTQIQM